MRYLLTHRYWYFVFQRTAFVATVFLTFLTAALCFLLFTKLVDLAIDHSYSLRETANFIVDYSPWLLVGLLLILFLMMMFMILKAVYYLFKFIFTPIRHNGEEMHRVSSYLD